jgi:uncharacterized protein
MMSRPLSMVKQHPLITFFVLAYALSWILESPLVFLGDTVTGTQSFVLVILASNVPSAVAIVLTAIVLGRGALRKLLGRLLIWRVDPRWYLVVILGPVALAGGMIALNTLVGGPALSFGTSLLFSAGIILAFSIFPGSALGEEIGWRGYALPRLQSRMNALGASLTIGVIWGLWHLPLWLTGEPGRPPILYAAFVVSAIALSVILTWVYNSTGDSLLLVVLLHATVNLPVSLVRDLLGESGATVPVLLYFGLIVVTAIVVVIVAGPKHLSRKHLKQEEEAEETGTKTVPSVPTVPRPA